MMLYDYTLERDNRELQHGETTEHYIKIIPLREIIGNYNCKRQLFVFLRIIPLREIIGNYNDSRQNILL